MIKKYHIEQIADALSKIGNELKLIRIELQKDSVDMYGADNQLNNNINNDDTPVTNVNTKEDIAEQLNEMFNKV